MAKPSSPRYYDGFKVRQTLGGIFTFHGHKDDIVTITRNVKTIEMEAGVDGEEEISMTHNFTGKAEIHIQQTSAAHTFLSTYMNAIETGVPVVLPYTMQDLSTGATIVVAVNSILEGMPDIVRKAKPEIVKWTLLLGNFDWFISAGLKAEKYQPA